MKVDSVRNSDGLFVNVNGFREEAMHFDKYGYYCPDPVNSPAWRNYWDEQLRRCKKGYTTGGASITGHHYFYLNFSPIMVAKKVVGESRSRVAKKVETFPDFWDGDYNYYHALDIARYGTTQPELDAINVEFKLDPGDFSGGKHMIVGKSRRKGYQQPNSEIVMTPNGETTMGELKIGDEVLTPTGKAKILEYYPQGKSDVYELTLKDGRKVKCGLEHLWKIYTYKKQNKVVDTGFFLNKKLKTGSKGKERYKYYIDQTNEVEYNYDTISKLGTAIHPYLLGLLIGDGSLTQGSCLFSTVDLELLEYIKSILGKNYNINKKTDTQYSITYNKDRSNPLMRKLKKLNLACLAKYKFIPDQYKYGTIEERYELVKGLMDSDGSVWKNGCCNFVNTSERLIDDLAYVLRSLGIRVKKTKNNNIGKGFSKSQAWTLIITTEKQIFRLKRKAVKIKKRGYDINKVAIVDVKKLNYQEENSCILIDSEDHLYLTKDFVVTHNSYKNGSISVNVYNSERKALVVLGAFAKEYLYPNGTMGMATSYINFINANTAWGKKREYVDKQHHKRSSYKEVDFQTGITVEKGYRSEILALTFKDNPHAARGKDMQLLLFEEAGAFNNLKAAYVVTEPSLRAGKFITGQIIIFGTGGDMEGGTQDFADMFLNPKAFNLLAFKNIWDEDSEETNCGFFHPVEWNMEGFYDDHGNSDKVGAKNEELDRRAAILKESSSTLNYQRHIQEWPFTPSEAFLSVSLNDFPIKELRDRLNKVLRENLHLKKGQPVYLTREDGKVKAKPDLKGELKPIWHYRPKEKDLTGAVVIYEYPQPNPPYGLYKIGYDPYMQDQSSGVSLGSVLVYKGTQEFSYTRNTIVAEYTGRPATTDDFNRQVMMLAELYNTTVMHENMVKDVKTYFMRKRKIHLLSLQPDKVISKNIKKSKVARVYGIHMAEPLKDAGAKFIKRELLEERDVDENGDILLNLETIYSPGLLEELIQFNMKGNFDRVMAYMMIMFQLEEEEEDKIFKKQVVNGNAADLLDMLGGMYKK